MAFRTRCLALLFPLAATLAFAQQPNSDAIPAREALAQHKITTQEQTLAALQNPDPDVRVLAARRLAEMQDAALIAAVSTAYQTEKDPKAKVGIAGVLLSANNNAGVPELLRVCKDLTAKNSLHSEAIHELASAKQAAPCVDNVLTTLAAATDPVERVKLIELLPGMATIMTPAQAQTSLAAATDALQDPEGALRLAAAEVLPTFGNAGTMQQLQTAMASEQDNAIRRALEQSEDRLQQKLQQDAVSRAPAQ